MSVLAGMLLAWLVAFVINIVPAFMPPTWSVLAAFHIVGSLPLLPLTIGGAFVSALGRMILAKLSAHGKRFLGKTDRANAEALGEFVNRHRRWRDAIFFLYCLGPFPSNPLFIAAGVGRIPLIPVTISFFISRAIADTFWVWTAKNVSRNAGTLFTKQLTSWQSIVLQVVALLSVVLVFRLPWARWLGIGTRTREGADAGAKQSKSPQAGGHDGDRGT